MKNCPFRLLIGVLCCLGVWGCSSGNSHDMAPVTGVVTLDGKPLANAKITFQPSGGGPTSSAFTDSGGKFSLQTFGGAKGAVVTEHRVVIYSGRPEGSAPVELDSDRDDGPVFREPIPTRYNERSELTFAVQADIANTANFDLSTK